MAATVKTTASIGSHHAATPMAMRLGMASGAATGKNESSWAQPLSGCPITANEAK
jgi:hypothetical protein